MTTFLVEIQSPGEMECIDGVVEFVGRDSSGSFGILANAERRMTVLAFGLASFHLTSGQQEYLALPGGLLYFKENQLRIATQNFVRSPDLAEVMAALREEIRASEVVLQETRKSIRRLDEEILKRLSRLNWKGAE